MEERLLLLFLYSFPGVSLVHPQISHARGFFTSFTFMCACQQDLIRFFHCLWSNLPPTLTRSLCDGHPKTVD